MEPRWRFLRQVFTFLLSIFRLNWRLGCFTFFAAPGRRLRQADALQGLQGGNRNQLVEHFFSKHLIYPLAVTRHRRRHQHGVSGRMQLEVLVGMGQRVVGYQGRDMGQLRRFSLQEFFPRGDIKEKIAHRDAGAFRQSGFFHLENLAAVDFDHRSRGFVGRPGLQTQPRNRCDRGQRFAAEPESGHTEQVFRIFDFGSSVTLEGEQGIVANHAAAIVGNLDEFFPARLYLDSYARRPGVQ